jgi:hypothetical protein
MPPTTTLANQSINDTQSTTLADTIDRTLLAGLAPEYQAPVADMGVDETVSALSRASGVTENLNDDNDEDQDAAEPTQSTSRGSGSKRTGPALQMNAVIGACDDSEDAGLLEAIIHKRNYGWGKLGADSKTMLAKVNLRILKTGNPRASHPASAEVCLSHLLDAIPKYCTLSLPRCSLRLGWIRGYLKKSYQKSYQIEAGNELTGRRRRMRWSRSVCLAGGPNQRKPGANGLALILQGECTIQHKYVCMIIYKYLDCASSERVS